MVLMTLFTGKEWKHRSREWTCGPSGGSREWGKMEKVDQHIYPSTGKAGEKLLYNTGSPIWCSVMT